VSYFQPREWAFVPGKFFAEASGHSHAAISANGSSRSLFDRAARSLPVYPDKADVLVPPARPQGANKPTAITEWRLQSAWIVN